MLSWPLRTVSRLVSNKDLLIISVKINIKDYPKNSFLSGITMTLHTQGTSVEKQESIAISPGEVFLVRISKVVYEKMSSNNVDKYDTKVSTMGDLNFKENWGEKDNTVVVAFKFDDLNVMVVRELPPYNILTFLSETGGVLGLLIGTSLVNLIMFLFQWGWGLKANEQQWFAIQNVSEGEDKGDESNEIDVTEEIALI